MAVVNHFIGACLNPLVIGIMLVAVAFLVAAKKGCAKGSRSRRWTIALTGLAVIWLWAWSTPAMTHLVGGPLEDAFPVMDESDAPNADAIVLLGGGMCAMTNGLCMADISNGGDRVWRAAELFKAGKAPLIIATGGRVEFSTVPFLESLGVPRSQIKCISSARNTEEEAHLVGGILGDGAHILLVTSSWHMRRSLLMFSRQNLVVHPFATDYEATVKCSDGFDITWLCPTADALALNSYFFKEHYAYWGYRLLRGY